MRYKLGAARFGGIRDAPLGFLHFRQLTAEDNTFRCIEQSYFTFYVS